MPRHLVIQLARFGDTLQSARLLDSLVRQGETHLCVDHSLVALARRVYPQVVVHGVYAHVGAPGPSVAVSSGQMLTENAVTLADLADLHVDVVYNLNHAGMNRAMARLFPSENVRGYSVRNGQELRERWMRLAFQWTRQRRVSSLNLMDFWGLMAPEPIAPQQVNPAATPGGKGLGVVLSGRHARRTLPPEVLGLCVHTLFESLGGPAVYLLGGKAERPVARQLTRCLPASMQDKITVLAGRTDLPGLVNAVQGLDVLLSPDTGTMHLAARLGVPVQATFLSSAWVWETGPYGAGHVVWQAVPPCAPCAEASGCVADMACLAPFQSPAFLSELGEFHGRASKNNKTRARNGTLSPLLRLVSGFDALGEVWTFAQKDRENGISEDTLAEPFFDPKSQAGRRTLRRLIAAYCHVPLMTECPLASVDEALVADTLYTEADWMLPDVHP